MKYVKLSINEIENSYLGIQQSNVFLCGNLSSLVETDFRRIPGRFTIPLSNAISRLSPGKSLRVRVSEISLARRHLLWYFLFKGITVLEWFILQYLLELTLRGGKIGPCACFAGVLSLGSKSRKRLDSWNSQLRPIHMILNSKIPQVKILENGKCNTLLDLVIQELKVPNIALSKSELYTVTEIEIPKVRPKEERFIGVGYKDKGTLPSGNRLESPDTDEEWKPTLNSRLNEALEWWSKISKIS